MCAAGRVPCGDPTARPGDPSHGGQDEDFRGAASGLPKAHRRTQGVSLCEGRTLQHASDRRGGATTTLGGKESTDREEDPTTSTGES